MTFERGHNGRPAILASVTSTSEAAICLDAGADLIDCKDPVSGALGALPVETVAAVVRTVAGRAPVSATIGDLASDATTVAGAAERMAAAGVDIVKVGLFSAPGWRPVIRALGRDARLGRARLVGVLMADQDPDFSLVGDMADAGFVGVMIDTAEKGCRSLPDHMTASDLRSFIDSAHAKRLFAGLAGSLRLHHIAALAGLKPDILGFRGALCSSSDRTSNLDADRIRCVIAEVERTSLADKSRGDDLTMLYGQAS